MIPQPCAAPSSIQRGVGGNNGSPDVLYFADGINGEADRLSGAITAH